FKSEWKKLSDQPINHTYMTDLERWICGCPYYLTSRFNICKHLIHQKGRVPPEFFNQVKRNWQPPFLMETDTNIDIIPNIGQLADANNITSNVDDVEDNNIDASFDELINVTRKALDLLEEQKSKGSTRWCKGVKRYFEPVSRLVTDVEQYRRKRTMPLTWKGHNDSTRYLE
ncbi:3543_t:CDS:1, partial [Paraglomus occultum]